jgi:hypothetical protein
MVDGVVFDNFIITSDQSIAKQYGDQIWYPKSVLEGKAISSASESVVDAVIRATKDRPWLWAVYLVAILLPLIILFVFCWSRKSSKKSSVEGLKKKTDEIEPDSNEQQVLTRPDEDEEETEEIEIDEQQTKQPTTNVTGKDALESEEQEKEVEDDDEEEEQEQGEVNVRNFMSFQFRFKNLLFSRLPNQMKMKVIKILHHHQLVTKPVDVSEKNNYKFHRFPFFFFFFFFCKSQFACISFSSIFLNDTKLTKSVFYQLFHFLTFLFVV